MWKHRSSVWAHFACAEVRSAIQAAVLTSSMSPEAVMSHEHCTHVVMSLRHTAASLLTVCPGECFKQALRGARVQHAALFWLHRRQDTDVWQTQTEWHGTPGRALTSRLHAVGTCSKRKATITDLLHHAQFHQTSSCRLM